LEEYFNASCHLSPLLVFILQHMILGEASEGAFMIGILEEAFDELVANVMASQVFTVASLGAE
jgi:hypothetical protein